MKSGPAAAAEVTSFGVGAALGSDELEVVVEEACVHGGRVVGMLREKFIPALISLWRGNFVASEFDGDFYVGWERGKGRDFFAVVGAQSDFVTTEEERYVHADLGAEGLEFILREAEFFGFVQVDQNSCRVAGGAAQSAARGDVFGEGDFVVESAAGVRFQETERLDYGVALPGQRFAVKRKVRSRLDFDFVEKFRDARKNGFDFMIARSILATNGQEQVHFGWALERAHLLACWSLIRRYETNHSKDQRAPEKVQKFREGAVARTD